MISRNLMEYYNELATNDSSTIDLNNVDVNNLYLFNTIPDDIIVPFEDQQILLGGIISMDDDDKQGYNYTGRIIYNHGAIYKNPTVNKEIKGLLK
jgi:hypothetical protein